MSKRPHLVSALAAACILLTGLAAGEAYATTVETRYVHALAPFYNATLRKDSVLKQAAFDHPDILLLFGSSEVTTGGSFNARALFKTCPTGFAVYEVGGPAADAVVILQEIAGLRSSLKDRKIVISLTPEFFQNRETPAGPYASNFLALDANVLAFRTDIAFADKQEAAQRMLEYPTTLERDPVLAFALHALAGNSLQDRALFFAVLPLGQLHIWIETLQNHFKSLQDIANYPALKPDLACRQATLDWESVTAQAIRMSGPYLNTNPFGLSDWMWLRYRTQWLGQKNTLNDKLFSQQLRQSREWQDLDLLLRILHAWGAKPLVITLPFDGLFYDFQGVSAKARAEYYTRLHVLGARYGAAVAAFDDHEYDRLFFTDVSHPSMKGWVYYDQALDAFYHDTLQ